MDDQSFVTKNVHLGEDVTLTCSRRSNLSGLLFWMRVVAGNLPELPSAPIYQGDSVTLQCSVLSDLQKNTCPEDVYWFRAGMDETHPSVIYVYRSSGDECERQSDVHSPRKCVYKFSKNNISSSDSGNYYCAVATCGHVIFGNGAKLNIKDSQVVNTVVFLLCAALAISLMVIALLSYVIKNKKYNCSNGNLFSFILIYT
uniref:Ig-like domain-containing protein n=1 Tax=Maylandia zebra TaxID=106582 RepID=A0A3P9ASX9_9CICH